jgi:two-component system NtrC family sensor kinase
VEELVEETLLLTRMGRRKGIEVETLFAGPTEIPADRGMLQQLFMNLFLNAADAMGEGGTLTVETGMAGDGFEVVVRDTGHGIPGENVDRIFDPFFSTRDRGTGLGMAIVATVVDAHGGSIEVDSTEGKGTAFIIRLPLERREKVGPETPRC